MRADQEENAMRPRSPSVEVEGLRGALTASEEAWLANVKIVPSAQGFRVRIDADRRGARSVIEEGYIQPEAAAFAPAPEMAREAREAMNLEGTEIAPNLWPQLVEGTINALNRRTSISSR